MGVLLGIIYVVFFLICSNKCQQAGVVVNKPPPEVVTPPPKIGTVKPKSPDWPGPYQNERNTLADWLLTGCWFNCKSEGEIPEKHCEVEGYDGWYNNIARPDSGAIDKPLLRRWPAAYEDGTYIPSGSTRPNPLELSEQLLQGDIGTQSKTGKNALLVFFGQQVVEEILDAQRPACPPEYFNIKIPENHTYRINKPNHTELPVLRTRYDQNTGSSPNNPRQQLNEITPYLDGGLFYGITKQWADQLRTYENGSMDPNGLLASSHDGLFPAYNTERLPMANPPPPFYHAAFIKNHETAKVSRFFKLGNPRGNENSFLLTFGIMWFRWHNYLAKRVRHLNPSWSSDQIFNEARKWVIATQQKIVVYDWLKELLLDEFPAYSGYDPSVDPQIDQFFQAAAFRFGHTLVVPGVYIRDYIRNKCKFKFDTWNRNAIRTCNSFWRPHEPIVKNVNDSSSELIDIDRILMGMSVQLSEREDHRIVEDLRGNVFGPLEFPRRDLMAINIQRGRDHGLPDFNTARQAFGLPRVDFEHFGRIIKNETILDRMKVLYNYSIDNIDIWVGGILETTDRPGELFRTIILDQFKRIRDADRFWFENMANQLFTKSDVARIKQLTIYDVIMATTKMEENDIPKNPFSAPRSSDNILLTSCKLLNSSCASSGNTYTCYHLPQLNQNLLNETCVQGDSYDYFKNSEISYILTFTSIIIFIVGLLWTVYMLITRKEQELLKLRIAENTYTRNTFKTERNINYPLFVVHEWLGPKISPRRVVIILKEDKKTLDVMSQNGSLLRAINFSMFDAPIEIYQITDSPHLIIKCIHNYDLVLQFETQYLRNNFLIAFDPFITNNGPQRNNITTFNWSTAMKIITTKEDRQELLEKFYRVVFAQAFKINYSQRELLRVDDSVEKELINIELTIYEFAEAMNMRYSDEFVVRMFHLIDKDKNGFISFREFVNLLVIFANGTEEEKVKLLFDMYDINAVGYLTENNFIAMIKSFLATVGGNVEDMKLQTTVKGMIERAGLRNKQRFDFNDFLLMIGDDIKSLSKTKLNFKGVKRQERLSFLETARETLENIYETRSEICERIEGESSSSKIIDDRQAESINARPNNERPKFAFMKYIELKSKEIFWLSVYTLVLLAIFAERAYYYSVEREHSGLRKIAGYGVTITRGAASAMMFTYSSLLITMCRNILTYLRDTVANKYFPFDASVEIHKYIAAWAFVFTVLHIVGHAFNFYHISTQTSDDLTCLFRNYFHATHQIPKFHYWCWETITGFTGIVLTLIWAIMYIFAQNIVRRRIYNWFWYTHSLYPFFFIFMILHGTGRLIQEPFFHLFFLGPVILFASDTLISVSRNKVEIPVLRAEILPSNVTMLEFKKPDNFNFKSGQWIRIACLALNKNEYHPFTLSSAPDENNLTVHIRAVGPWTSHIRTLYDNKDSSQLSTIYLDGPYGEGHQNWNLFNVSILIGGGIGVTPFASILKDLIYKSSHTRCQKVYFIWVSRTQKQFEWLIDIIRELEHKDVKNKISCHIFITQFFEKFDLRTIFLYICERHYKRISNRSLFTNLKAVTHFSRPNFPNFFNTISSLHENVHTVGVFSCGPPSMTVAVERACNKINGSGQQKFKHHYKNF